MSAWSEIMAGHRRTIMSLIADKRCQPLRHDLQAALNLVSQWQRNGDKDENSIPAFLAFNAVWDESSTAVNAALDICLSSVYPDARAVAFAVDVIREAVGV